MNNNEWITDRLPTYADARRINATHMPDHELYGEVWVWQGQYRTLDWELVKPGTPWQPIATPAPYYKPKRWTVRYCKVYRYWAIEDAYHITYLGQLTENNDKHREAAERIAAIYEEVTP